MSQPRVVALLLSRGLCGLAFFVLTGTFDLFCKQRFSMTPETFGYFLSFIGLSFAVSNGLLVPFVHRSLAGGGDGDASADELQKAGAYLPLSRGSVACWLRPEPQGRCSTVLAPVAVVDGWEETASNCPFRACKKNVIYPLQTVVGVVTRTHSLGRML